MENIIDKHKACIYCYTGTGNSLFAAKQFSSYFGDIPIKFIVDELLEGEKEVNLDFSIILLPSYAFGIPRLVKRWIKNTKFNIKYLAVAVLQGSKQRGTAAEAVKLFKKGGQAVSYASAIDSVENYVHLFGHPSEETQQHRNKAQVDCVCRLCKIYENGVQNEISLNRPLSAFVSAIFRSVIGAFVTRYRILDTCNSCEICRKVCPPKAIFMKEEKGKMIPAFIGKKCDHCQACMQLCPQNAIKYFKIKPNFPRYKNKFVTLAELIKRE